MKLVSNGLPKPALDLVAGHRLAHLLAYRQPNAWHWVIATRQPEHEKRASANFPPATLHTTVVRRATQT